MNIVKSKYERGEILFSVEAGLFGIPATLKFRIDSKRFDDSRNSWYYTITTLCGEDVKYFNRIKNGKHIEKEISEKAIETGVMALNFAEALESGTYFCKTARELVKDSIVEVEKGNKNPMTSSEIESYLNKFFK